MNRRQFMERSLGAAALGRQRLRSQAAARPNIILITASGWRGQALSGGEDRGIETPNLERLAREGTLCRRAYTTNPASSPARVSLLTGRFPHLCGVLAAGMRMPPEEVTIAEALQAGGYRTGYIGEWDLDGEASPGFVPPGERRQGFGFWAAANRNRRDFESQYFRDEPEPLRTTGFDPDFQTGLAIEFIRRNRAGPFFLALGWSPPDGPREAPPEYAARYSAGDLHLRFNVPAAGAAAARRAQAAYYAMCSALDTNAGRILDTLEEIGISEQTVVLFTSDRGEMLRSHDLDGDGSFHEESARVPLIIRYPAAIPAGGALEAPVSVCDLAPTLLAVANSPIRPGIQGRDLSGALVRGEAGSSESIYCQGRLGTPGEWRMVVRGLDKVVVDRNLEISHLFNLGQDPYEMENLAEAKGRQRKRDELSAIVQDWMKRSSDRILPSGLRLRD